MRIGILRSYLDDLGLRAAEQNRCTLATGCQLVLDGRVGDEMIDRIVRTISWQETQMLRVGELLEYLASNHLISHTLDAETAHDALAGRTEVSPLDGKFNDTPEVEELQGPWDDDDRYVAAFFFDAFVWLLLECNRLLRPSAFDTDQIKAAIIEFLRNSPVE